MLSTSVFSETPSSLSNASFNMRSLNIPNARLIISEPNYDWKSNSISRLEKLIRLSLGWDGYNGQPVSLENAYFALNLLQKIYSPDVPAPQIVPGVSGDLQIEWHTHSVEIELHILAPYKVRAWILDAKSSPEGIEFDLTMDFTEVARAIKNLKERSIDTAAA